MGDAWIESVYFHVSDSLRSAGRAGIIHDYLWGHYGADEDSQRYMYDKGNNRNHQDETWIVSFGSEPRFYRPRSLVAFPFKIRSRSLAEKLNCSITALGYSMSLALKLSVPTTMRSAPTRSIRKRSPSG